MPITKFDRHTATYFGPKVAEALAGLAREYGLTVRSAGGTFDDGLRYTARVEFEVQNEEIRDAHEKVEFANMCELFGLKPDDFMRQFEHKRVRYELRGFKPGHPKPILTRSLKDGQTYLFPTITMTALLGRPPQDAKRRGRAPRAQAAA